MSKPTAKADAKADAGGAPPKNKKLLIIIIAVLLLVIAGGAGWYFTKGHAAADEHAVEAKPEPKLEPKFVPLGDNFTVNLQREEGDQYLQAGITLKILQPELEEKIKSAMPEIRSRLLFLLSSKRPSQLQTVEGKQILVSEIISTTDAVLGISPAQPSAPAMTPMPHATPADPHAAPVSGVVMAAPAPHTATVHAPIPVVAKKAGVVDVLFTSFIIQ